MRSSWSAVEPLGISQHLSTLQAMRRLASSLRTPSTPSAAMWIVSRLNCLISVKIQYGDVVNDLDVEDPLNVITGAVRFLIGKYWRAYFAETCLEMVEYISTQAASSLREQFRYEGWQVYGRAVENTNEQNEINWQCIQHVESAVSYVK
jgi:hypothetical protein